MTKLTKFLRRPEVEARTGLARRLSFWRNYDIAAAQSGFWHKYRTAVAGHVALFGYDTGTCTNIPRQNESSAERAGESGKAILCFNIET